MEIIQYNEEVYNNNLTCYICLDNLNISLKQSLLCGCPNRYHKKCLYEWISKTNKCPICKQNIYKLCLKYENIKNHDNIEEIEEILDILFDMQNIYNNENLYYIINLENALYQIMMHIIIFFGIFFGILFLLNYYIII